MSQILAFKFVKLIPIVKYSLMSSTSLLYDLALAATLDSYPILTEREREEVRDIVTRYSDGGLTYEQASQLYLEKFNITAPIHKIRVILEVGDEPLPPYPSEHEKGFRRKTQQWTASEDTRLLAGICRFGHDSWSYVARFVGSSRTRSQCSQRWLRGLDPRISRTQWTVPEEEMLLSLVAKYGEKSWIRVSMEMGNRSDVQCRYRYLRLQSDQQIKGEEIDANQEEELKSMREESHEIIVPEIQPTTPDEKDFSVSDEMFGFDRITLDLGTQSTSEIFWMLHA
jgi:hypothetical protein